MVNCFESLVADSAALAERREHSDKKSTILPEKLGCVVGRDAKRRSFAKNAAPFSLSVA
jgi:hypothetical protein